MIIETNCFSKKHHYIPQYYIKGFTNQNGCCYLLKKGTGKIDRNQYNPKSIFYESFRNTITYHSKETDFIEQEYGKLDNIWANIFQIIQKGVSEEQLFSDPVLRALKQFIALFVFRLPITDYFVDDIIDNFDLHKTRNKIEIGGTNILDIPKIKKLLKSDKGFRYYFRCFALPLLFFDYQTNNNCGRWYLFDTGCTWQKHLCTDNPILIKNANKFFTFDDDIIFPLTKSKLLIFSKNKNIVRENIPEGFISKIDMLLLWKAQRYVVGPDKEYLEKINDCFNRFSRIDSIDQLNKDIFSYLEKY